jgi:hypothetical protein
LNPIIAGVLIINDKDEFKLVSMPTLMMEPDKAFDTAAIWGNNLSGTAFVTINSFELMGSVIGIISKANDIEHKFVFFHKDLCQDLPERSNPADKFKVPNLPSDLSDITKLEDADI